MKKWILLMFMVLCLCACTSEPTFREADLIKEEDLFQIVYDGDTYVNTYDGINPVAYVEDRLNVYGDIAFENGNNIWLNPIFYDNHSIRNYETLKEGNHTVELLAVTAEGICYSGSFDVRINDDSNHRQNVKGGYPVDTDYHFVFENPLSKEEFDKRMMMTFDQELCTQLTDPPYMDEYCWKEAYYRIGGVDSFEHYLVQVLYSYYYKDGAEYVHDVIITRNFYYPSDLRGIQKHQPQRAMMTMNEERNQLTISTFVQEDKEKPTLHVYDLPRSLHLNE